MGATIAGSKVKADELRRDGPHFPCVNLLLQPGVEWITRTILRLDFEPPHLSQSTQTVAE